MPDVPPVPPKRPLIGLPGARLPLRPARAPRFVSQSPEPGVIRVRTEDNVFQHLDVLKRNRTKRHRFREFFVEGVRAINLARAHGWTINALAYAADRRLSGWA